MSSSVFCSHDLGCSCCCYDKY